ncbi:MAG: type VI secretion system contractile sheath large subunit [gamma proteobacterium endosymbiont of Lamellibrachia anaximandri]|nr:type VI secretion system contractile sheath large subunit [gamma proteobacterium endosymbiont of Lamellibrachia anaximandri]MBL3535004.1 type VI secretion system contractile sheath large subunit [gamma proteobacterium endosymbiont of Lamellibrachia anaximandri]
MAAHMEFEYGLRGGGVAPQRKPTSVMRILLMGDFSGHSEEAGPLDERAVRQVDVDNFAQMMARYAPSVNLQLGEGENARIDLTFSELEDFHPDALFQNLNLFKALRQLRGRLLDANTFTAAAELRREASVVDTTPTSEETAGDSAAPEPQGDVFERLLGRESSSPIARESAPNAGIEQFIQRIVAAHIVPDADPQQAAYVASVDDAIGEQMRSLLHAPEFQALEARWLALYRLVTGVETDETLKLYMLDITSSELLTDLAILVGNPSASSLYRLLVEQGVGSTGGKPWSVLAGDFVFGAREEDVAALHAMGLLGSQAGGPFLATASPQLLGCDVITEPVEMWAGLEGEAAQRWQALRQTPAARWLGLTLPRPLMRLPYGKGGEEIDSFAFEEIPLPPGEHDDYLWGSPAFACAQLLAEAFVASGWAMAPGDRLDIEDLPAFTFEVDGERQMLPCAEAWISERAGEVILKQGVMPLLSHRTRNMARVMRFQSLALPPVNLAGVWR